MIYQPPFEQSDWSNCYNHGKNKLTKFILWTFGQIYENFQQEEFMLLYSLGYIIDALAILMAFTTYPS